MRVSSPSSESDLLAAARDLTGRPLATIAADLDVAVPPDLRRAKGWVGQILEAALGASAGSAAQRDFPALGVELKSIPVDASGRPRESTFVCTAPLDGNMLLPWADSWVRAKLARVLWVPVIGDAAPGERVVGEPRLWSPTPAQDAVLAEDWDAITELIGLGYFDECDARVGDALQLRPKAASSRELAWAMNADGEWVQVNPRGFYLRATFTATLLAE